jgi:hypothetical protein
MTPDINEYIEKLNWPKDLEFSIFHENLYLVSRLNQHLTEDLPEYFPVPDASFVPELIQKFNKDFQIYLMSKFEDGILIKNGFFTQISEKTVKKIIDCCRFLRYQITDVGDGKRTMMIKKINSIEEFYSSMEELILNFKNPPNRIKKFSDFF